MLAFSGKSAHEILGLNFFPPMPAVDHALMETWEVWTTKKTIEAYGGRQPMKVDGWIGG